MLLLSRTLLLPVVVGLLVCEQQLWPTIALSVPPYNRSFQAQQAAATNSCVARRPSSVSALLLLQVPQRLPPCRDGMAIGIAAPRRRCNTSGIGHLARRNDDDDDDDEENSDNNNNRNNPIEILRRALEVSWNIKTMGPIPTSAESAALAAGDSIRQIMLHSGQQQQQQEGRGSSSSSSVILFVDVLLPQYDITRGLNLYDAILAIEFCIALANQLEGKSVIIVRDKATVDTVQRVFQSRQAIPAATNELDIDGEDDDDDEEEDVDDDDDDDDDSTTEFDKDVSNVGTVGDRTMGTSPKVVHTEVAKFRNRLENYWVGDDSTDGRATTADRGIGQSGPVDSTEAQQYRLTSMLGGGPISAGADMSDEVLKAVADNVQPREDEGTLIILSAVSREEMIGVRSLVAKYNGMKTIVLVNCQLNPMPRELFHAKTVYSVLPLIARPVQSERNLFGSQRKEEDKDKTAATPSSPKVVVLRRYPGAWEVYIDTGHGFELAASVPADRVDKKGPSLEWVATCIKRHMGSRF